MLSSRSMSIATQPMPPSAIATLSSGKRTVHPAHSHSVHACSESWLNSGGDERHDRPVAAGRDLSHP